MFQQWLKRLKARWGPALQSDTEFVEAAFREILGRNADLDGLRHYQHVLRQGVGRTAVLLDIMRSDEFRATLAGTSSNPSSSPPNLRDLRPDAYRHAIDRTNGETIVVFDARSSADFDWLEEAILRNGYYEKAGVWNLGIDADKRVIAEMIAAFAPNRALELGCAAGAVLECLDGYGIAAEGVELSAWARAQASERVRDRIHGGDVLAIDLPGDYDMVFGLDVFEHLNPNRMTAYLTRLAALTRSGGYLFCNIPAFGQDAVFGTVFPLYVEQWLGDAGEGRPFTTLHVDDHGYPLHGHLTWADAAWWTRQFEALGFHREIAIEEALHRKYDDYMQRRSPARRSYFVFSKEPSVERRMGVIRRITVDHSQIV